MIDTKEALLGNVKIKAELLDELFDCLKYKTNG